MPYKRIGPNIYHMKQGHWQIKQRCKNNERAKAALRILSQIERKEKGR